MEGVNQDTVWTWNAIGKRAGAWNLSATAPESAKGFLLNHVISELLPPQPDGHRYANIDPVTGSFLSQTTVGAGITLPPVVANSMLYIYDDAGRLTAYR